MEDRCAHMSLPNVNSPNQDLRKVETMLPIFIDGEFQLVVSSAFKVWDLFLFGQEQAPWRG